MMQTIFEALHQAMHDLLATGLADGRLSAEYLLAHVLRCKRLDLYLRYDQPLQENEMQDFLELIERRKKREPVAYLCKSVPFYTLDLEVSRDVLIPRPETELLVDKVVELLKKEETNGKVFVDLCAGSGCIGIAVKKSLPHLRVVLSDISLPALNVAKRNALKNSVAVEFHQGDLLEGFSSKVDFLCCNPPYVSEGELSDLEDDVIKYEPLLALIAKSGGYEFYERLAKTLPPYLNRGAKCFFEIGSGQKERVFQIFCDERWRSKQSFSDWNGKNRFFFLENE
jgi:release factor glutamine methyltransferase